MSHDDRMPPRDRRFVSPGTGHPTTWLCMGCGKARPPAGARGVGAMKRCAHCLAAKSQRKAA